jgi:hypothetical protein
MNAVRRRVSASAPEPFTIVYAKAEGSGPRRERPAPADDRVGFCADGGFCFSAVRAGRSFRRAPRASSYQGSLVESWETKPARTPSVAA